MVASLTSLPVLGVPIESKSLKGIDSLLSVAQMPAGVPVGTLAIGKSGAKNAAILAVSIISLSNKFYERKIENWRENLTENIFCQKVEEIEKNGKIFHRYFSHTERYLFGVYVCKFSGRYENYNDHRRASLNHTYLYIKQY